MRQAFIERIESVQEQRACTEKEMINELGITPKTWAPIETAELLA